VYWDAGHEDSQSIGMSDWNLATKINPDSEYAPEAVDDNNASLAKIRQLQLDVIADVQKVNIGKWENSEMPTSCNFMNYKDSGQCVLQWTYPSKLLYSDEDIASGAKAEVIFGAKRCEGRNADGLPALALGGIGALFKAFAPPRMCAGGDDHLTATGCDGLHGFQCIDFKKVFIETVTQATCACLSPCVALALAALTLVGSSLTLVGPPLALLLHLVSLSLARARACSLSSNTYAQRNVARARRRQFQRRSHGHPILWARNRRLGGGTVGKRDLSHRLA